MLDDEKWQKQTLEKLVFASLKEQRSRRRWGIFFKLFIAAYLVFLLFLYLSPESPTKVMAEQKAHAALIDVKGPIFAGSKSSADDIIESLKAAFDSPGTKGVILRINSPGGSPVQADEIYNEIKRQRKKHPNIKIYAVCTDICASGAYYVAAAADDIYANPASLVGSIGVILNGFGFVDSMKKLGVERRVIIAGHNKDFLDPFTPLKPAQRQEAQRMVDDVHQQFINKVKAGRGSRLKINADTFSGLVWTGNAALAQGLIDGFASPREVARDKIKVKHMVDYTVEPSFFERVSDKLATSLSLSFRSLLSTHLTA